MEPHGDDALEEEFRENPISAFDDLQTDAAHDLEGTLRILFHAVAQDIENPFEESAELLGRPLTHGLHHLEVDGAEHFLMDLFEPPDLHDLQTHEHTEPGRVARILQFLERSREVEIGFDDVVEVGERDQSGHRSLGIGFGGHFDLDFSQTSLEAGMGQRFTQLSPAGLPPLQPFRLLGQPCAGILTPEPKGIGFTQLSSEQDPELRERFGLFPDLEELGGQFLHLVEAAHEVFERRIRKLFEPEKEVTQDSLVAAYEGLMVTERRVDRGPFGHRPGDVPGHFVGELQPVGDEMIRREAPGFGTLRGFKSLEENVGQEMHDGTVEG